MKAADRSPGWWPSVLSGLRCVGRSIPSGSNADRALEASHLPPGGFRCTGWQRSWQCGWQKGGEVPKSLSDNHLRKLVTGVLPNSRALKGVVKMDQDFGLGPGFPGDVSSTMMSSGKGGSAVGGCLVSHSAARWSCI